MNHARGAARLLYLIGPGGMNTELNKTLLAVQSAMIVTERLRDGHDHLYAAPEWQRALQQTIKDDLPPGIERSEANVTLNMIAAALPNLFNRVEKAVMSPDIPTGPNLRKELNKVGAQFQYWQQRWETILRVNPYDTLREAKQKFQLAVFFMYKAILNRLVAAAPASPEERTNSEHAALEAANGALEISAMADPQGFIYRTKITAVSKLVRSVADTSDDWQREIKRASPVRPIGQALFRVWCDRTGRESEALK